MVSGLFSGTFEDCPIEMALWEADLPEPRGAPSRGGSEHRPSGGLLREVLVEAVVAAASQVAAESQSAVSCPWRGSSRSSCGSSGSAHVSHEQGDSRCGHSCFPHTLRPLLTCACGRPPVGQMRETRCRPIAFSPGSAQGLAR